ncbi:tRNA (adenosine(37)-N6)-threonylcarbamoyltransferase complex transferase subunit TsaD [Candidatus Parcubacteria bacterium]|nr:tRNA (adenosine(37)-N6)-threonylcarbamoyltransferase complex transferase subunit TsaD [Patescibacteria group bacterium]MBU4309618.1 tRNA (adenosine(37)-N6)-threonylcarbamoyltransferase complex transferase subunit TsaD [Patescibacteria group bacterium]MBU4432140.1 tRNA (adenosine(37)-N6)-threonylcarbamoyltransferase complex transferase subunit TsaD [Patescibacteria group bacterium]MBU4577994.1 tRNA (adenosine(37)-N6)-threonylcarbamoyltransferase complex transferase subunit TsaD [Patescibacteri
MIILGIETSCDETAASIIKGEENKIEVLSNIISSQIDIHRQYGGVVPEVAAREHVLNIMPVIDEALKIANLKHGAIDAIAVTVGPGLVTSLQTGVETAKVLSYAWNIPVIGINHIEGHIAANFIGEFSVLNFEFPMIVLTVSGGHTMLILSKQLGQFETVGETVDDAAGEAFDKAAKLMDIGYPGGPIISTEADKFNEINNTQPAIKLPRPMLTSKNFNFSFSGLKTALRYALEKDSTWQNRISEYCFHFQQAIIDVLIHKTIKAAEKYNAKTVMLAGGVSANKELRLQLETAVKERLIGTKFNLPDLKYTTDNAAMIAAAGYFKAQQQEFTKWSDLKVDSNLEL